MFNIKVPNAGESLRRRSTVDSPDTQLDRDPRLHRRSSHCDRLCVGSLHPNAMETPSPDMSHHFVCHYTPKCLSVHRECVPSARSTPQDRSEVWQDATGRTNVRVENEVEALRVVNNYRFGFRKWKSQITETPLEERSDVVRELYSELNFIRPQTGSVITCGNVAYVFIFGWWISLMYLLVCVLMFLTVIGSPYGKLCWKLACYFIWPFGKPIQTTSNLKRCCVKFPNCEIIPEEVDCEDGKKVDEVKESTPLLKAPPITVEVPSAPRAPQRKLHWCRCSTYVWLLLGYPLLGVTHCLACFLSWFMVFTIPVAKMNARTLGTILLMPPEDIQIRPMKTSLGCETRVLQCCYHAFNWYYYKYSVQGINIFAVNVIPLVIVTLVVGYVDSDNQFVSSEAKFATAVSSIIPLSYYIGMGIASISAQSNFAVGAVVNATFGSITEMTFYITALLRGHQTGSKCYEEIVLAALTGTLLGCILFIPGICMIIGGFKHSEQRFNSRSTGVSAALLFISVGGVFAPTLFSKAYGDLVCDNCTNTMPGNISSPFICKDCHYDSSENNPSFYFTHIEPLVYTISVLLPAAYIIGLIFTLKTHSHIYDIYISDGHAQGHCPQEGADTAGAACDHHGAVVLWSRAKALGVMIMATILMAACADLTTEHIKPILSQSSISQYFIGVTVLAMVPELPEIVNGIQFALQNNISLSLEVGTCIAVQVCMIQIPLLILVNAFYDLGFVLIFCDLHLWASIFSVILVNYIFMDGKCDYFQGTALVVVYLILVALYFFAPSPPSC